METARAYLAPDGGLEIDSQVLGIEGERFACARTGFFPGGGGQPCDRGQMILPDGAALPIVGAHTDVQGTIWHLCPAPLPATLRGARVRLAVDAARRAALSRYHTVLHILNTVAWREHGAWITGAQIEADYARIDFKLERLSPQLCGEFEQRVNAVVARDHPLRAYELDEAQFAARGDLLRTLEVAPPVREGRVRVVEIDGFDAQACGGTHVRRTGEIGRFAITRSENKGRINKRLYVRLD